MSNMPYGGSRSFASAVTAVIIAIAATLAVWLLPKTAEGQQGNFPSGALPQTAFTAPASVNGTINGFVVQNQSGNAILYVGPTGAGNSNGFFGFGTNGAGTNSYKFYSNPTIVASPTSTEDFAIIPAAAVSTPTTPVGSTTILASAPAGTYRLTVYYVLTTAGVGGTSITLNVSYTDAQGAQTNSSVTSSGLVLGQFVQSTLILQQQAAGNITYTVTEGGTFSTHPVLALKLYLEKVN